MLRKGVNEHSGVSYVILCHLTLVPAMSVLKYRLIILIQTSLSFVTAHVLATSVIEDQGYRVDILSKNRGGRNDSERRA